MTAAWLLLLPALSHTALVRTHDDPFRTLAAARARNRPVHVGKDIVAVASGRLVGLASLSIEDGALRRETRSLLSAWRARCAAHSRRGAPDESARLFVAYLDVACGLAGVRGRAASSRPWRRTISEAVAQARRAGGNGHLALLGRDLDFSRFATPSALPARAAAAWRARRWLETSLVADDSPAARTRGARALGFGLFALRADARLWTRFRRVAALRRLTGGPDLSARSLVEVERDVSRSFGGVPDPRRLGPDDTSRFVAVVCADGPPPAVFAPQSSGVFDPVGGGEGWRDRTSEATAASLPGRFALLLAESYPRDGARDEGAALAALSEACGPLFGRAPEGPRPPADMRVRTSWASIGRPPRAMGGEVERADAFYAALARFATRAAAEGRGGRWLDREFARRFRLLASLLAGLPGAVPPARGLPDRARAQREAVWNLPPQLESVCAPTARLRDVFARGWVIETPAAVVPRAFGPCLFRETVHSAGGARLVTVVASALVDGVEPEWAAAPP